MDSVPSIGGPPIGVPLIGGDTRLYALLGDPISQVRAPGLMNTLLARKSVDAVFFPVHVRRDDLDSVVNGLQGIANLDGMLVTVPHKSDILRFARPSVAATLAGSANAMRREPDGSWLADNFDGAGFVAGLRHAGHDPAGWRVCVVGGGGAGSAIAAALLHAGVNHVHIGDPDGERL